MVLEDEEKLTEIGMRLPDFDAEVRSNVIDMIGNRIEKADVSKVNGENGYSFCRFSMRIQR